MTVSTTDSVIEYVSGGPAFPIPYRFLQNSDIQAVLVRQSGVSETLVLGTQYTLTGAGSQSVGTLTSAYAAGVLATPGASLTISRVMDPVQPTDLRNQGRFLAETHETVFDRLTMLIQQGFAGLSRALKRPVGKNYYDAEGRRIANVADPVEFQDAATKSWAQQYIADILATGQGPINNAANIAYVDGDSDVTTVQKGVIKQFASVDRLRQKAGDRDGEQCLLKGWYASTPGLGGGKLYWDSLSVEADNGGTVFAVSGVSTGRWKRDTGGEMWAEWFGAQNDGTDTLGTTTAAIWSAIRALRKNPKDIIQYIDGPTVTGYESGELRFGRGVFAHAADTFLIDQDLGLTLRGQGGRGMSQAIYAPTTLLQKGVSSGFAWRHYGNAGRALRFENIDICYENSDFTGDVIDTWASPDLYIGPGCRVGCYGGTAGTRVQTARSCVRATYQERASLDHCVIDGAVDGVWHDYSIERTLGGSNFGGWGMNLNCVTFYDFTGTHMKCAATRAQFTLGIKKCNFNPINISPVRCLDLQNVEGLEIEGCIFTPSTSAQPTAEYFSVLGCTGQIRSNVFLGASSKVGTIGGPNPTAIDWSNNSVACGSGLTITGGTITGSGNEYSIADHGVDIAPVAATTLDIGPDIFKSSVTGNSYRISADSALLSGRINYSFEQDNSNSKYASVSSRVTMGNIDSRFSTLAVAGTTLSPYFAGRTYNVTVAGTQTLPTPIPGSKPIRVLKSGANALTIAVTPGTNFLVGASGSRTSAIATAADVGSMIEFEALNSTTWVARVMAGTWSFT